MNESSPSAELLRIFKSQQGNKWNFRSEGIGARHDRLKRLADAIRMHAEQINAALAADLRKLPVGLKSPEITAPLHDINVALEELDTWTKAVDIEPSPHFAGNRAYVQYEPRGVCLLFGPWNFPFGLVMQPLVAILAAGNSAIVKPNELAPETSRIIRIVLQSAFSEQEVAVVEGDVSVSNELLDLPFDHIFFTGSPAVGRHIMAAASRHLSSVTLELGGKCPAILDDSADLAIAAPKIAAARYYNAGQLCIAVDHVWIPKSRQDEFVDHLKNAVDAMFYSGGELQKSRLARLVNERNFLRVKGYIDDALERGAKLAFGGKLDESDLTIHPSALTNVSLASKIMQEEIFGPVLPIMTYDDVGEVLEATNAVGKPLAVYVFSNSEKFVDRVLDGTSSGGVTINDVMTHAAESRLPFGGVNQSGMGRYKGFYGFQEMSNARSVFVRGGKV